MSKKSSNNILVAFLLNLSFSIFELIGGIFTNSISIISDSVHDFGDAIAIAIAWILEKKSQKGANTKYTYGYARYSVLGAFITSMILLVGSIFMIMNAVPRIFNPVEVNYDGMIVMGIIGLIVNSAGAFVTAKGKKISEKAVSLHLLEDVLGWLAVLIVSIVMKIWDLPILDPILSIGIVIFILFHVIENIKSIFEIFLEKAPQDINIEEIKKKILKDNEQIKDIHHTHIWTLDGTNIYMTLHALVSDDISNDDMIELKKYILHELEHYNASHVTIEFEFEKEHCDSLECKVENLEINSHHHHHH